MQNVYSSMSMSSSLSGKMSTLVFYFCSYCLFDTGLAEELNQPWHQRVRLLTVNCHCYELHGRQSDFQWQSMIVQWVVFVVKKNWKASTPKVKLQLW